MKRPLYFAVTRSRGDAESIVSRFNAQLRGMIADRTYHRLLHVDWIRADINGDGVAEYVPLNDRTGRTEPEHVYTLFSSPEVASKSASTTSEKPGFFVGGNIYRDWASVPDSYKIDDARHPDPRRSTATLFRFSW